MVPGIELTKQEALPDRAMHPQLETLPDEILLQIISHLEPSETRDLQLVCRRFLIIGRDQELWRWWCFRNSSFCANLDRRRKFHKLGAVPAEVLRSNTTIPANSTHGERNGDSDGLSARVREGERVRIMHNWDPSFPSERVSWFEEYIQRQAPITVNWLQLPRVSDDASQTVIAEPKGVALYRPDNPGEDDRIETLLAVSPLDDGSVCLWDVNGTRTGRRGAIVARSRPGILFIDGPDADNRRRSKRIDSGVTECVSVDSHRHRAYFSVQSHLIEVDLKRLCVVDLESYPWSITAISTASPHVPLTVGTSHGIHLYDSRAKQHPRDDKEEFVDGPDSPSAKDFYERKLRRLFLDDGPLPPYASLAQPGPLSILHLERPGQPADLSDDLYVAGRFSSLLHYDRRKFPGIKDTIHSGASLCAMTSLPYPFSSTESELRRMGQLSRGQVTRTKSVEGGQTLIACGDYNTKGSLEMYGLSSEGSLAYLDGGEKNQLQNRSLASRARLLSVVNHGTRVAVSDGTGHIKWFERDGFTEVRACKIGHSETAEGPSIFASMPGSDDIARKLLPTRAATAGNPGVNDNDLLFWTGDKLGLVRVSTQKGFTAEDFEESSEVLLREAERVRESEQKAHGQMMMQALKSQADDARLVRNLGLGSGHYR